MGKIMCQGGNPAGKLYSLSIIEYECIWLHSWLMLCVCMCTMTAE